MRDYQCWATQPEVQLSLGVCKLEEDGIYKKIKKSVIQSSYSAAQNYMDKRGGEQGSLPGMAKCPLLCAWWFCKSDTVSHSATVLWAHFVCTGYGYLGKTSTHLVWLQRDQWYRKRWADSDSLKFWTSAVTLTINTEVRSFGKTKIWSRMTASVFVFGFWQDTLAYDGVRTTTLRLTQWL